MKRVSKLLATALIVVLIVAVMPLEAKEKRVRKQRPDIVDGSWKGQVDLGVNVMYEGQITPMVGGSIARWDPSLSADFRLSRHSGIGVGVGYRVLYARPSMSSGRTESLNCKYISIPVSYKYYGRVMNFLAVASYDYMFYNTDNSSYRRNAFSFAVGISKDIRLSKHIILEPAVHVGWWTGIGIGLKYRL